MAAVLFAFVDVGDLMVPQLTPHFGRPAPVTLRVPMVPVAARDLHLPAQVHMIVPRGVRPNPEDRAHVLAVLADQARRPGPWLAFAGSFVFFLSAALALTAYLREFGQNRLRLLRTQIGLLIMMALFLLSAKLALLFSPWLHVWLPTAAVPLWVAGSFERRAAIVVAIVSSFMVAALLRFDVSLLAVSLCHGLGSVLMLRDKKVNRNFIFAGLWSGLGAAVMYLALLQLVFGSTALALAGEVTASPVLGCVGGGLLAGILGSVLRSPAERLLGHVPRERLHALTDLERPLLKRMAQEAPGSWEHSRAMANLAEQAAAAIGADALLVRVGAYYHDLGKSLQPKFFVENLGHGERSPHDEIAPEVSAEVILAHVEEGTRILREGGIPEPVVEFAYTHHGTSVVEYFWNKCKERGNPGGLDKEFFRYPGMKPQTKETAILMLVDSIEAASRTIDPPKRSGFETMVQRIVFTKLASGQLDDSGLRMRDLKIVVTRMVDTLVNMNHHRVKYPWQAKQAEQFGVPARAVSDLPTPMPLSPRDGDPGPAPIPSIAVAPAEPGRTALAEEPNQDKRLARH